MTDIEKYEARQPVTVAPETTPASLLAIAVKQGADLDKLEKLMNLQERYEQNEARKAYVAAMAEFKKNPPEIVKDMTVSFGQGKTSYTHASLAGATQAITTELSKHGLSGKWDINQDEKGISVSYILTHIAGHSETTTMTANADTSGSKNSIQAIASTVSYLERYTMLAGTGLAAKGMDTDGNLPKEEPEPITKKQTKQIRDLIKATGSDETKFMVWMKNMHGTAKVEELDSENANQVIATLKAKKEAT